LLATDNFLFGLTRFGENDTMDKKYFFWAVDYEIVSCRGVGPWPLPPIYNLGRLLKKRGNFFRTGRIGLSAGSVWRFLRRAAHAHRIAFSHFVRGSLRFGIGNGSDWPQ